MSLHKSKWKHGSIMKHEKAPAAPNWKGILNISLILMVYKFTNFGHFWPYLAELDRPAKRYIHTPIPFI